MTNYTQDADCGLALLCNDASGNPVDASPNSQPTTGINLSYSTAGSFGTALGFNGTDSRIQIPYATPSLAFTTGAPIAIVTWLNVSTTREQWLVAQGTAIILRDTANKAQFILNAFPTNDRVTSTGNIGTGSYAHIAGVYYGTNLVIYINGVEEGSVTPTGTYTDVGTPYLVATGGGTHVLGDMDEIAIFTRSLDSTEVNDIKDNGLAGAPPPASALGYMTPNPYWGGIPA